MDACMERHGTQHPRCNLLALQDSLERKRGSAITVTRQGGAFFVREMVTLPDSGSVCKVAPSLLKGPILAIGGQLALPNAVLEIYGMSLSIPLAEGVGVLETAPPPIRLLHVSVALSARVAVAGATSGRPVPELLAVGLPMRVGGVQPAVAHGGPPVVEPSVRPALRGPPAEHQAIVGMLHFGVLLDAVQRLPELVVRHLAHGLTHPEVRWRRRLSVAVGPRSQHGICIFTCPGGARKGQRKDA
mmetsp:Transcript_58810/g.182674  ORF Transcript_58810/g.182674 Transcript_58810/m.182674 type:complete len:244 (+) Transcript_58810:214-945(+)